MGWLIKGRMHKGQARSVISFTLFLALSTPTFAAEPARLPQPKPDRPASPFLGGRTSGATYFEVEGPVPVTWGTSAVTQARSECPKLLQALDITYKAVPSIGGAEGCGAPAPIEVSAVAGIKITPPATLTCPFAQVLHKWVRGAVQQAAAAALKDKVLSMTNVASYTCRPVRADNAQRLSEHALSNALDISAFTLERTGDITVSKDWIASAPGSLRDPSGGPALTPEATFLRYAHESACEVFSTVLGPDHNAWHKDHLHFDHGRKGRYGLCQ